MHHKFDSENELGDFSDLSSAKVRFPCPFGAYLLLQSLAKGGMGEVYLAKQGGIAGTAGIEKYCVVKTLRSHHTVDREYVARFMDEARVVVNLDHRNICQVFDVGRVGQRYYLSMELAAVAPIRSPVQRIRFLKLYCQKRRALRECFGQRSEGQPHPRTHWSIQQEALRLHSTMLGKLNSRREKEV
ncbi:MAG: protein kinase [Deltaproteobacteria bacterium]|nr:protein kinase [Deltaproteobacteria bacterium]